jgi:DNA-binding protein HU-beta
MSVQALTDAVAGAAGVPKISARTAVDATIAQIVNGLVDRGAVVVAGLGTFSVKNYAATTGRHPRTGEPIEIAARRKVKFKMAKALRDALNQG